MKKHFYLTLGLLSLSIGLIRIILLSYMEIKKNVETLDVAQLLDFFSCK